MTEANVPLSASEIARRTALGLAGIGKAVAGLLQAGIVESVGTGSRSPIQLRSAHPLAAPLRDLFLREREYFELLISRIREAATHLTPPPQAVWIEGPVARSIDRLGDPLVIGILTGSGEVDRMRDALEDQLELLQQQSDVTIDVRALSRADVEASLPEELDELRDVIVVLGPEPSQLLSHREGRTPAGGERQRSHAEADARALALGTAIADRIATDSTLVPRARAFLAKRLTHSAPGEERELREWDRVLRTMSTAQLRRFLVQPGERATRLRQTLPFVEALSAAERRILEDGFDTDRERP